MPIIKYLDRISLLHRLIKQKATGTPRQLSLKLGLSERQTYEYIREIKEMGIPVAFDSLNKTYYYKHEVRCVLEYRALTLDEQVQVEGGSHINSLYNLFNKLTINSL